MRILRGGAGTALVGSLVVAVSLAHLFLAGRSARETTATNLPSSPASAFRRTVELVHPNPEPGRVYNLTVVGGGDEALGGDARARLFVQIATEGRVRPILVKPSHGDASRARALAAWLAGDVRLELVSDRGWLDLGPAPRDGESLRLQLIGLLPAGFAFVMPNRPSAGVLRDAQIVSVDGPARVIATTAPRYRIVVPAPAGAAESLARLLFFVGQSRVLAVAAAAGALLLVAGWLGLRRRPHASVSALVAGIVLLRAALLPPLQGADETSHVATIEYLGCCGTALRDPVEEFPPSIVRLADALDQNRVQHQRDEPLPIGGSDARRRTSERIAAIGERASGATALRLPAGAALQPQATRAPAYYQLLAYLWPLTGEMPVLERVALYRVLSAAITVLLWSLGAFLLATFVGQESLLLLYACIPLLVPIVVDVMATTSNYAVASGLGAIVGGAAVAAVVAETRRARIAATLVLPVSALLGTRVWADYWLLVIGLVAGGGVAGAAAAGRRYVPPRVAIAACIGVAAAIAVVVIGFVFRGERLGALGSLYVPEWNSREGMWMIVLPLVPLLWAATAALLGLAHRHEPIERRRRHARRLSAAGWAIALLLFLAVPFSTVPYETAWLDLPDLVRAYAATFFSTNFSFDQDTLSWKLYWGTFGWHDAFYPPLVYAVARWSAVALFLSLPLLTVRFSSERPYASAALLLVAGAGVSFSILSELIRQVNVVHPVGRYLVPWLPLAALPALARLQSPGRERWLRLAVRIGVALEVWTAIAVVGARYAFGSG